MRDFAKALTAFINGTSAEGDEEDEEEPEENESLEPPVREPFVEPRPKRLRRREESVPSALPPRGDRAKKKAKSGIPVGFGAIAATALVVLGVVIGAFVVGNRNTRKTPTSDYNPLETAELSPATGQAPTAANPTSPTPPAATPSQAATSSGDGTQQPVATAPASHLRSGSTAPQSSAKATNPGGSPHPAPTATAASEPPAAQTTQRDAGRAAKTGPPSDERADSPDSPAPRRGSRPQPDDDNPPPPQEAGRVPFDGGPKRGESIEQYFNKLDTNHDGRLDPSELPLHIIYRADTNKDGELTLSEVKQAFKKRGQRLFAPPTAAEMRRLPRGGPPEGGQDLPGGGRPRGGPPAGGPPGSGPPGNGPTSRTGGL